MIGGTVATLLDNRKIRNSKFEELSTFATKGSVQCAEEKTRLRVVAIGVRTLSAVSMRKSRDHVEGAGVARSARQAASPSVREHTFARRQRDCSNSSREYGGQYVIESFTYPSGREQNFCEKVSVELVAPKGGNTRAYFTSAKKLIVGSVFE